MLSNRGIVIKIKKTLYKKRKTFPVSIPKDLGKDKEAVTKAIEIWQEAASKYKISKTEQDRMAADFLM